MACRRCSPPTWASAPPTPAAGASPLPSPAASVTPAAACSLTPSVLHAPRALLLAGAAAAASRRHRHYDHDCPFGWETHYVYVFYFPQDTPLEVGPTELLSGSHFLPMLGIRQDHTQSQTGTPLAGPAGTVAIADFSIMHRRAAAAAPSGTKRHMLKMVRLLSLWPLCPARPWLPCSSSLRRYSGDGRHRGETGFTPRASISARRSTATQARTQTTTSARWT